MQTGIKNVFIGYPKDKILELKKSLNPAIVFTGFDKIDFISLGKLLLSNDLDWDDFWCCELYCQMSKHFTLPDFPELPSSPVSVTDLFGVKMISVIVGEWITKLDRSICGELYLVFDGLELIQTDALTMELIIAQLMRITHYYHDNVKYKIFLPEEIWDNLRFDNKSHCRTLRYRWIIE